MLEYSIIDIFFRQHVVWRNNVNVLFEDDDIFKTKNTICRRRREISLKGRRGGKGKRDVDESRVMRVEGKRIEETLI